VAGMTEFGAKTTIGAKYGPAMSILDQAEADAWFEACVIHCVTFGGKSRKEAERIERANIGYWTGYCDAETAERVFRLFKCSHPIFGTRRDLSPETIFEMGIARGKGEAGSLQ